MATKGIKGAQIHATGGRPAGLHHPTNLRGTVKQVSNLRGGNMLVGHDTNSKFSKSVKPTGPDTVKEARGFHLA